MNAFSYPSKRGINFAKIRGFKVTDYKRPSCPIPRTYRDTYSDGWRRLATSKLGGYGSPLVWAPGKGPTRGGRHPVVVGAAV